MADPKMARVEDFSDLMVRTIRGREVAAAIGLVLPWALDISPALTLVAAAGVVLVMIGAAVTQLRRDESQMIVGNVLIGVLALIVAIGRFGAL